MSQSSPPSLAQLQQQFSQSLHYQEAQCHVVENTFQSDELLQLYRNNFIISLIEVLAATYPCIQALVGEECFEQVARQHVLSTPLQQGDVTHYGEGFDTTLQAIPQLIEAVPYLVDLAKLEWLVDRASLQTPSPSRFPIEQLVTLSPHQYQDLQLHVHPYVLTFGSVYPIASIWNMVNNDSVEALDLNQPEWMIVLPSHTQQTVIPTTKAGVDLITHSQARQPLGSATEAMLDPLVTLVEQHIFSHFSGIEEA
ncbi:DNA-binding domain-containing protein [Vibrio sp. Of7-15]|uniref:HvfC/BufC N-terminal domain-containing protein n=1 Tax=Vibrio sp. Of7-15 TaxID=2724879 RepID=UPI001EF1F33E|nr:DNA-binding domain-containing protein [Vibrio sp. Of7-15]MCG7496739.1 DNA-binding domain-containing protein [Vibrio sp. Of7-15]